MKIKCKIECSKFIFLAGTVLGVGALALFILAQFLSFTPAEKTTASWAFLAASAGGALTMFSGLCCSKMKGRILTEEPTETTDLLPEIKERLMP